MATPAPSAAMSASTSPLLALNALPAVMVVLDPPSERCQVSRLLSPLYARQSSGVNSLGWSISVNRVPGAATKILGTARILRHIVNLSDGWDEMRIARS